MNLKMDATIADGYQSASQQSRVITETWVESNVYCINCGHDSLNKFENNRPVADFYCGYCEQEFELKSKRGKLGKQVIDGEYYAKIERLNSSTNPNLLLLGYDDKSFVASELLIIPRFFFTEDIIEKRKALSSTARRAGWVGSNIHLESVPESGRIFFVKDGKEVPRESVLAQWNRTRFLDEKKDLGQRGWLIDTMRCVERLHKETFLLSDMYSFESELAAKHPENRHVRDKIRQQLQVLRDKGYLEFLSRGEYRLMK